jgi:phage-related holin
MIERIKFYFYLVITTICWYLNLAQESVMILTILIVLDFTTWIIKSKRIGEEIRSKKGVLWILSKLLLILIPITIALVGKWVWIDLLWLVSWAFAMIIVSEWYSVISNITIIITWKKTKEEDALSIVLHHILDTFKKVLNWIIKDYNKYNDNDNDKDNNKI